MTLKPPTRTLPKLVMKEWPDRRAFDELMEHVEAEKRRIKHDKQLADFTRVVEEMGVLDHQRPQKADIPSKR